MNQPLKSKKIVKTDVEALTSKLQNKKAQLENLIRKLARTQFEIQKLQRSIKSTTASLKKIREIVEQEDDPGVFVLYESGDSDEDSSLARVEVLDSLDESDQIQRDIALLLTFFNIEDE